MFSTVHRFSVLRTGARARLLVATVDPLTGRTGDYEALLTTDPDIAENLRQALTRFTSSRYTLLADWSDAHPGVRCELRRVVGAALVGAVPATGPLSALVPLLTASRPLPAPARDAVRQIALTMLEGSDDIPVRVTLSPEHLEDTARTYANTWLTHHADDAEICDLLAGSSDVAHDSLMWELRERLDYLEEWLEEMWVGVDVNLDDLAAWVAAHRPHLAD